LANPYLKLAFVGSFRLSELPEVSESEFQQLMHKLCYSKGWTDREGKSQISRGRVSNSTGEASVKDCLTTSNFILERDETVQ
jgi:hypothetical protein